MKRINTLIIIMILVVSFSCSKKKECTAFNDADLSYIPYNAGDTLSFKSSQGESFEIYINSFSKSESYKYKCKDLDGGCPCINSVDVISTSTSSNSSFVFLKLEQSDVSDMQYYKYRIVDYYFEFDFRNELPHIQDFNHIELIGTQTISNEVYSEVLRIRNIDIHASTIAEVYFNKTDGILKYIEKNSGKEWCLE